MDIEEILTETSKVIDLARKLSESRKELLKRQLAALDKLNSNPSAFSQEQFTAISVCYSKITSELIRD